VPGADKQHTRILDVRRLRPSAAAEVSPSVKIIGRIVYPVAATLTARSEAVGYLAFLRSITAKAIFEQLASHF
jgi:molybdate transport system substrate-binding protein